MPKAKKCIWALLVQEKNRKLKANLDFYDTFLFLSLKFFQSRKVWLSRVEFLTRGNKSFPFLDPKKCMLSYLPKALKFCTVRIV